MKPATAAYNSVRPLKKATEQHNLTKTFADRDSFKSNAFLNMDGQAARTAHYISVGITQALKDPSWKQGSPCWAAWEPLKPEN